MIDDIKLDIWNIYPEIIYIRKSQSDFLCYMI